MRFSALVTLLLLALLFCMVQGIRLGEGFLPVEHQKIHEEEGVLVSNSAHGVGEADFCEDGNCSGNSVEQNPKTRRSAMAESSQKHYTGDIEDIVIDYTPAHEYREPPPP